MLRPSLREGMGANPRAVVVLALALCAGVTPPARAAVSFNPAPNVPNLPGLTLKYVGLSSAGEKADR